MFEASDPFLSSLSFILFCHLIWPQHACTHTHTHTHIYTYIHTYIHTRTAKEGIYTHSKGRNIHILFLFCVFMCLGMRFQCRQSLCCESQPLACEQWVQFWSWQRCPPQVLCRRYFNPSCVHAPLASDFWLLTSFLFWRKMHLVNMECCETLQL